MSLLRNNAIGSNFPVSACFIAEAETVSLPSGTVKFTIADKPPSVDMRKAFIDKVNEICPDFLVVGCAGRKGPKLDPTVLGKSADYTLREARQHRIVVKNKSELPAKGTAMHIFVRQSIRSAKLLC